MEEGRHNGELMGNPRREAESVEPIMDKTKNQSEEKAKHYRAV